MVSYMDTTPHEHSGEDSFMFKKDLKDIKEEIIIQILENFSAKYIIPEVSVEYSQKLNKYFLLMQATILQILYTKISRKCRYYTIQIKTRPN